MPVSFGTPDKFNASKGYRHVLFGKNGNLAEWELNELQKIQRDSLASLAQALTGRESGVFSGDVTFNGSTVTATNVIALVKGELVKLTGTLAATNGDTIYIALTETTVTKETDADIQYPDFNGNESTRRIKYDVALSKSNADATKRYMTLGTITGGNLNKTYDTITATADVRSDGVNVITLKSSTASLVDYPIGITIFHYGTGDAGYPLTNAIVTTYNAPDVTTGYQTITGVQNGNVHQRFRQFNGTSWTAWSRDAEIESLRNRTISTGSGLSGGGDLTANRTISINFGGNGTATTVARSDHNHDAQYLLKAGGDMSGILRFGAGQASNLATPVIAGVTQGIEFNFDSDTHRIFAREDTAGELTALVVQMGDNANDRFIVEGMDNFTSTPKVLFEISKTAGAEFNTDVYATGDVYEQGALLNTRYASRNISINTGDGLTGGGSLSASRTLSVNFAGSGTATTVARSDHSHALSSLTQDASYRTVSDTEKTYWNGKASREVATPSSDGLMSRYDKANLDSAQKFSYVDSLGYVKDGGTTMNLDTLKTAGYYHGRVSHGGPTATMEDFVFVEVIRNSSKIIQRLTVDDPYDRRHRTQTFVRKFTTYWHPWDLLISGDSVASLAIGGVVNLPFVMNFTGKATASDYYTKSAAYLKSASSTPAPTAYLPADEFGVIDYQRIYDYDGTRATTATSVENSRTYQMYAFNLIDYYERRFGRIPAADKVTWLAEHIDNIRIQWHGFGSGRDGNGAYLGVWKDTAGSWSIGNGYWGSNGEHTNATVTKLFADIDRTVQQPSNFLTGEGILYCLAFADPASATVASSLSTEKIELVIDMHISTTMDLQPEMSSLKMTKTNKDSNGVYRNIEYRRKTDNALVSKSTLTGGTSPRYTTRTVDWYNVHGDVYRTDVFTITYDSDGDVVSEL